MAKPIPEMPSSVFVALVGRPNVGKSSLTNYLVGEKVAIVTKKPQTTRSRITGVITKGPVQYVLMDTPGIHKARNKLDARMTQTAAASLKDVDVKSTGHHFVTQRHRFVMRFVVVGNYRVAFFGKCPYCFGTYTTGCACN